MKFKSILASAAIALMGSSLMAPVTAFAQEEVRVVCRVSDNHLCAMASGRKQLLINYIYVMCDKQGAPSWCNLPAGQFDFYIFTDDMTGGAGETYPARPKRNMPIGPEILNGRCSTPGWPGGCSVPTNNSIAEIPSNEEGGQYIP